VAVTLPFQSEASRDPIRSSIREGYAVTDKHEWFEWRGMICCKRCGIIKRPNSPGSDKRASQSPCRGEARITLRRAATDLLTAINHSLDTRQSPQKYGVPFGEARVLALALDLDTERTP
jgi:hypothetical protein